jgi:hypothetical protein
MGGIQVQFDIRFAASGHVPQHPLHFGSEKKRASESERQLAERRQAITGTPSACARLRKLFITL